MEFQTKDGISIVFTLLVEREKLVNQAEVRHSAENPQESRRPEWV